MKIIKDAPKKEKEEKVFFKKCQYCGCEFEFKESEGSYFHHPTQGDFIDINCPSCGRMVCIEI